MERRVDFVDPPIYTQARQLTQEEIDRMVADAEKKGDVYASNMSRDHPPRETDHWRQQADKLKPGMTSFALYKFVPAASTNGSWLIPRTNDERTQVFYYAVDAEYAALCEMTTNDGTRRPRVVRMLSFFPHQCRFTDFGSLNLTKLAITSGPEPIVVFED